MNPFSKWNKLPIYYKLFLLLTLSIAVYLLYADSNNYEGFRDLTDQSFKSLSGAEVYDDSYAAMYDGIFVRDQRINFEYNKLFKNTNITKDKWILDVGCGTGHLVGRFHKDGLSCVGMDRSKAMIRRAKENYPEAKFVLGDASLPSHNYYGKFDIISCMYFTYYEMKDREQFLKNCFNWLKPHGKLYLHLVEVEQIDPIVPVIRRE